MIAIKHKTFELDKPNWIAALVDAHKRKERKIHNKLQRYNIMALPSAAITRAKPYDTQYHAVSVVYILRLHNSIAAYKARCLYLPERQMSSKNALA